MNTRQRQGLGARLIVITGLLVGLPLLGAIAAGKPLAPYFQFPPERTLTHAGFAWPAFVLVAIVFVAALALMAWLIWRDRHLGQSPPRTSGARWPWWTWVGIALLTGSWLLAWTRFEWFAPLQAYTFTPQWLGYIIVVDAINFRLQGSSLIAHHGRFLASLFPLSALFWWYFEYLNRYVQNWIYIGIGDFGPIEYAINATLAFSTVLPAVVATQVLWHTLLNPPRRELPIAISRTRYRHLATVLLAIAVSVLFMLSLLPNYLFPFLWIAPLLVLLGLQGLGGEPAFMRQLRRQGWQVIYLPALAALTCGFFWEFWNYYSYAKWTYSIPFVDRFHLFEMPVLGYAGYLPFGLECMAVALLLQNERRRAPIAI